MEDDLAREGVLARCNLDRSGTLSEAECISARRAAAALAFQEESERRGRLERESQRKLLALRERSAREAEAKATADAAARDASKSAYEARWPGGVAPGPVGTAAGDEPGAVAAFGAPLGPVLPSIAESAFDFYPELEDTAGPEADVQPPNEDAPTDESAPELAELALTRAAPIAAGPEVAN